MTATSKAKILVAAITIAAGAAAQSPGGYEPGRRVLLDAHNAYPYQGRWGERLQRALATGVPVAIEQDLVWRPATAASPDRSIVSHGEPFTGKEPTLRDFFEGIRPIVTGTLTPTSREQWPLIVLNLDFKDRHPQHFAAVWDLLGEYEAWLTTARRTSTATRPEPLHVGPVLVLTGSDPAQQAAFHDAVPIGGRLRLFGALPTPAGGATNYGCWLNHPWSVIEPEGQNRAAEWTPLEADHLRVRVRAAHAAGLWIRFYTLNGHSAEQGERMGWSPGYNFGSLEAVRIRWHAAIAAGVDFVATDQYEEYAQISSR